MSWGLRTITEAREWRQDGSGMVSTVSMFLNPITPVRLDIYTEAFEPIVSVVGNADAVRKAFVDWLDVEGIDITFSAEHISYIGAELARAELLRENYVQS